MEKIFIYSDPSVFGVVYQRMSENDFIPTQDKSTTGIPCGLMAIGARHIALREFKQVL